ncbi:MAG: hypothetical protein HEQ29_12475 [Dolichospermum sp. LBC05a]|nr:hypothetical protein [Dolichospermum sp. OL01]MCO5797555.1 hypothetical protein [Dolichospermum sp. OL03]MCS6279929.1 hypothetical protein [Dolichospermum sp.]QSV56958.1 MAG: hypothetical protein HEQ29_12475 [Dolichospermum sp. LBC05a]
MNKLLMKRISFSLLAVLVTLLITFTHAVAQEVPFYWDYINGKTLQLKKYPKICYYAVYLAPTLIMKDGQDVYPTKFDNLFFGVL